VQSFNTLQQIFSSLNFFLLVLAAGLGLFIISSHLRSRSLKMVFTKPCPPALWLGSAFLAAVHVSLVISCVVFSSAILLSLIWHVPVRTGLLFISLDTFFASLGLIAYLMLLATVAHPAIAALSLPPPAHDSPLQQKDGRNLCQSAHHAWGMEIPSLLPRLRSDPLGVLLLRGVICFAEEKAHLKSATTPKIFCPLLRLPM
jgi:hypothetical protein